MVEIKQRHNEEMNRLYDKLATLEPGTEEYTKVLNELMKAMDGENEITKISDAKEDAKWDRVIKIGTFAAGLVIAPFVDTVCKRSLAKFIGTVEQMETFTSSPGRSISSWFRWK